MRCLFDTYVVVDWSAAAVPRVGRDSIWICHRQRRQGALGPAGLANPATRHAAEGILGELLAAELAAGRSVLAGFDFGFGYPAGLATRLELPGTPWRAVWDRIAEGLVDDEANLNNRFGLATELNRRISGRAFPFWGCPASRMSPFLAMTCHRDWARGGLAERRLVEHRVSGPQPGWKLAGTGSAGSQNLTGIPVVRRLRDDPRFAGAAQVWPFETGLRAPGPANGTGRIVLAEIYPSLVAIAPRPGEVKDSAQVRAVAAWFAERDAVGEIAAFFAGDPDLTPDERRTVETEEGWILGVVRDARRPKRNAPRSARRADRRPRA
jgi:precorrin-8X/cobalt-precorrin-8 methylmutase